MSSPITTGIYEDGYCYIIGAAECIKGDKKKIGKDFIYLPEKSCLHGGSLLHL